MSCCFFSCFCYFVIGSRWPSWIVHSYKSERKHLTNFEILAYVRKRQCGLTPLQTVLFWKVWKSRSHQDRYSLKKWIQMYQLSLENWLTVLFLKYFLRRSTSIRDPINFNARLDANVNERTHWWTDFNRTKQHHLTAYVFVYLHLSDLSIFFSLYEFRFIIMVQWPRVYLQLLVSHRQQNIFNLKMRRPRLW